MIKVLEYGLRPVETCAETIERANSYDLTVCKVKDGTRQINV